MSARRPRTQTTTATPQVSATHAANHPALRHDACSLAAGQNALVLAGPRASKYQGSVR